MNEKQARVFAYILQILSTAILFLIVTGVSAIFAPWSVSMGIGAFAVAIYIATGFTRTGAWILFLLLVPVVWVFSKKTAMWLQDGGNREFGE